jgi:hypothetical protein
MFRKTAQKSQTMSIVQLLVLVAVAVVVDEVVVVRSMLWPPWRCHSRGSLTELTVYLLHWLSYRQALHTLCPRVRVVCTSSYML